MKLRIALIGVAAIAMSSCASSDDTPTPGSGGSSAGGTTSGAAGSGAGTAGMGGTTSGAAGTTSGTAGTTSGAAGAGGSAGSGAAGTTGQGGAAGAAGAAGSVGSAGAGGTAGTTGQGGQGNLPAGVKSLFPAPNGQNLCPDPPLKITFNSTPVLGSSGRFRVFTSGGSVVATVDMAATTVSESIGGMTFMVSRPVYVESGAITAGGAFSITDTTTWRFTTMAGAPSNKTAISVALDGSGSFCSVQGAFDFVPANNTAATTITVGAGAYHEIVRVNGKNNVTLAGADRNGTVISGTNNNNVNPSTKGRSLFGVDGSNTVTIRNLTIKNLTPQGGSQAEALRLESCDKCVVRDATVISLQDTLLWSGRSSGSPS
jgi:hypothetical protein